MYNHAPRDYECPICLGIQGIENNKTMLRQSDVVYQDSQVSAFINSFFIKNNPGHVIIVPNKHIENLYELPADLGSKIIVVSQKIAQAMKVIYKCDGITIQQNNEPAGGQHAFHYHMHVFPRYENDEFYSFILEKQTPTQEDRKPYADKLKKYF